MIGPVNVHGCSEPRGTLPIPVNASRIIQTADNKRKIIPVTFITFLFIIIPPICNINKPIRLIVIFCINQILVLHSICESEIHKHHKIKPGRVPGFLMNNFSGKLFVHFMVNYAYEAHIVIYTGFNYNHELQQWGESATP